MNRLLLAMNWTSFQTILSIIATILLIISSINYLFINKKQRAKVKELEILINKLRNEL